VLIESSTDYYADIATGDRSSLALRSDRFFVKSGIYRSHV